MNRKHIRCVAAALALATAALGVAAQTATNPFPVNGNTYVVTFT